MLARKFDGSDKIRAAPWGNQDEEQESLCGDALSVSLEVFHLHYFLQPQSSIG